MFSVSDSAISGFEKLILLLNIFYFTFNPCEINPIMIQLFSVLSDPINIFANFQKAIFERYAQYQSEIRFIDSGHGKKLLM